MSAAADPVTTCTAEPGSVGLVQTQSVTLFEPPDVLQLECGRTLGPIQVAYETYGALNADRSNAVLVCHALSGDAHAAGRHQPDDRKPGWWDVMIGPGKGLDTTKYFVICANVLGGCKGTTGPSSLNPATGQPWGIDFPVVTIEDMVKVQKRLVEHLGIARLLGVTGGSMGGMQTLEWAVRYPDSIVAAIPIATTARLNAQSIAFDAVGRNAILADPAFAGGQYHGSGQPERGLSIARMVGHITYLSEQGMHEKFGRELRNADRYSYDFSSEFSVETYLDHQGRTFVERFDANSYLYITKAMDYYDLIGDRTLAEALAPARCRFLVISFTSDWLFTPRQSRELVDALLANEQDVSYCDVDSPYGHDAFLLEPQTLGRLIGGFLAGTAGHPDAQRRLAGGGGAAGGAPPFQGWGTDPAGSVAPHSASPASLSSRPSPTPEGVGHPATLERVGHPATPSTTPANHRRRRLDYERIAQFIAPGNSVLDLGCGDGGLLRRLVADKRAETMGVELDQERLLAAVGHSLTVVQFDLERDLSSFKTQSWDYVVLSKTLQTLRQPAEVLRQIVRIGRRAIVSFPNAAHWRAAWQLLRTGHVTQPDDPAAAWHETPNLRSLSVHDFEAFCGQTGLRILQRCYLADEGRRTITRWPNHRAQEAIYVLEKRG